jgi:hypothetical protein
MQAYRLVNPLPEPVADLQVLRRVPGAHVVALQVGKKPAGKFFILMRVADEG